MAARVIGAFFAVIAFSILIEVPKRYFLPAGCVGALGWFVYLFCDMFLDSVGGVALLAALSVALSSHILARVLKAPVSTFLIPGILPLVPGGSVYRFAYSFIHNSRDTTFYLTETVTIAGGIALAIFLVDSIFKLHRPRRR